MTMDGPSLKSWRAQRHISQLQLAEQLGIHYLTVSRWERGYTEVPPYLGLALNYLDVLRTGAVVVAPRPSGRPSALPHVPH